MPEKCFDCLFHTGLYCEITGICTNGAQGCPLIEIPSPHGKLIDVSSLDPYNGMWKRKCIPMEMVYNARAVAYEAPAIIEAEVEE